MTQAIQINDNSDEIPICPHCEQALHTVNARKLKTTFGVRHIYFCKRCKKALGISHRKGFFMG